MDRIIVTLAAACLLIGLPLCSRADENDGNPFKFTNSGGFIDGEPDASYTAPAYIQVGTSAVFSCKNTDTRTRTAATECYTYSALSLGGFILVSAITNPDTKYNGPMTAGQEIDGYSATALATAASVPTGTYTASGILSIFDNKTGDSFWLAPTPITVTVH